MRWHFHPEYELHHVVATTGRYFVGDFIGTFEPGNLVLTGPNLPHNWVSDVEADEIVPLRNRGIQFTDEAIRGAMGILPELQCLSEMLDKSRSGLLFSNATSEVVAPNLAELMHAHGICPNGSLRLAGRTLDVSWRDGRHEHFGDSAEGASGGGADPMRFTHAWHQGILEDFVDALETGRPPVATGRRTLRVHALIDALATSSSSGTACQVEDVG